MSPPQHEPLPEYTDNEGEQGSHSMFCMTRCTLGVQCVSPQRHYGTSNVLHLMVTADLTFFVAGTLVQKASWVVHHGICLHSHRSVLSRS
jgi:hypothetical protein